MVKKQFDREKRFIHQISPTPLIQVRIEEGGPAIWCKLEFLNPSGSCKDRIARYILEKAWRKGKIMYGDTVIEASSGSTSIALALACAQMGLNFIAVMTDSVSSERIMIIKAYGGEIITVSKKEGMSGVIEHARNLAHENGYFLSDQFRNPDNPEAHKMWTGQEILSQLPHGSADAIVAGVGTGGTLVGLYQAFTGSGCTKVKAYAARPVHGSKSINETECCSFSSRVPGVLDGVSKILNKDAVPDLEYLEIDDDEVLHVTKKLIRTGFPVGPSSGLNFTASVKIAERLGNQADIITVFPDRMERYFSTELFSEFR